MVATLNVFFAMRNDKLPMLKDYSKSFCDILRQIVDRKLPRDFDYHKVPAPWVQIKLLKLMALVGADDQAASQPMYEVVQNCLMRAEGQGSAAYAVFFSQQITSKWSNFGRLDPSGDPVGDGRPQQSPGRAAGAGLPSPASSVLTDSGGF